MKVPQFSKEFQKPKINLPKHKETNSIKQSYNLGNCTIELNPSSQKPKSLGAYQGIFP
jgi:hypothetical protein